VEKQTLDEQLLDKLSEGQVCFPESDDNTIIAVKYKGEVFAYKNACPHLGIPLNTSHDRIAAKAGQYLVCSGHGAIFDARTGKCVAGPCNGAQLQTVAIT